MKRLYALIIALLIASSAMTQTDDPYESCLPNGIWFQTQTQIDSFQINYPNCTEIEGNVDIFCNNYDITNLNGLNALTSIGGRLEIRYNNALTNITGLDNLTFVGGDLWIQGNYSLTSLTGLGNLTSIGGELWIYSNNALTSLTGLDNVTSIGADFNIYNCDALQSLTGLDNLTCVGGDLQIGGWSGGLDLLTSLTGLDNLTSIGGELSIIWNYVLTSLTGLNNLTSIGGGLSIHNNALTSLTSLDNVTSVGGDINISVNNLFSLAGLDNINAETIGSIEIIYNSSLSNCAILSICNYLSSPNGNTFIENNASGCNSPEEVQESCEAHAGFIDAQFSANYFKIYPNPTHATITIELPAQPSKKTSLTISSTNGQQLFSQPITTLKTEIDISQLPVGIYIVKVWNEKDVMVRKVIKR